MLKSKTKTAGPNLLQSSTFTQQETVVKQLVIPTTLLYAPNSLPPSHHASRLHGSSVGKNELPWQPKGRFNKQQWKFLYI